MRLTESQLRKIIREVLLHENFEAAEQKLEQGVRSVFDKYGIQSKSAPRYIANDMAAGAMRGKTPVWLETLGKVDYDPSLHDELVDELDRVHAGVFNRSSFK